MKSEPLAVAVVGAGAEDPTAGVEWRTKKKVRSEREVGKRREKGFLMLLVCVCKILGWIGYLCIFFFFFFFLGKSRKKNEETHRAEKNEEERERERGKGRGRRETFVFCFFFIF